MEETFEDELLLPNQPSSPAPKPKLRRLKKTSEADPRDPPAADPDSSHPSPSPFDPPEAPMMMATRDLEESVPELVDPVAGSDEIGTEIGEELELDPLFPDLPRSELKNMEIGREEEGFDWGIGSGSAGVEEMNAAFENVKSAKKRLNLAGEGETTKKNKKKSKSGEKPKESLREKKMSEKERKAQLVQIHAESQRLLRETRDASFRPVPLIQKPISSVLEKIRLRKLEVLKKSSILNHSEPFNETLNCEADICHDAELSLPENEKDDGEALPENKFAQGDESLDVGEGGFTPSHCEDDLYNQASNPNSEDASQTLDKDISSDSEQTGENNQLVYSSNDTSKDTLLMLPTPSSKFVSKEASSLEEDGIENIDVRSRKVVHIDACPEGGPVKAFLDDEAEEEDDSDHDLMRFQENEEEDESDDNEELDDLIATGFEEAPTDYERRNQLHQKWLEQQDTAATDNVLHRLRCHQKQKEPTFSQEEEENEESSEDSEEESYDLPPTNDVHKNTKLAKHMIAKMYTDDHDAYLTSDDEETEQTLVRQRLLKQNEESTLDSVADDGHSKEVFGLIKKLNKAPDSKKRVKTTTSNFDMLLMRGNNNSSSKSSFLGRATSCSMQSSHKQGSTTVRAFIFGRDDSNSRSSLSASENLQDVDQMEKQHKKPSAAKYSGSQVKSGASKTKTEAHTSTGSSLFEILRQSSICFDKQMDSKMRSGNEVTETQAAYQFSAFKLGRKFSKV